ncbi:MAG: carboxypeptidase-like regulatory domain-containing protein [Cyclobacteriaceae bacterium]
MITSSDFFAAATEALGMTILHSLWQGFLLMLALGLFLRFGKSLTPATRFSVAFITLLLLLTAFVGTFYQQWSLVAPVTISPSLTETLPAEITKIAPVVLNPTGEQLTVTEPDRWEALFSHLTIMAPWLAWVWLAGSLIFIIRLANGLVQNRQLQSDTTSLPADWPQRFGKLIDRLQIRQSVRVESTERTKVPLTIGWMKPVILIPASILMSLPIDQVEAIMVHELAHIKRQDYLWNLIQSAAEVVLFYHPVYWYISSVLERERELACDALTVATTRQPRTYAQALLEIAARASAPIPTQSLAASGKRGLLSRIQQIMNPDAPRKNISVLPFLLLLSMLSLSLVAFAWHQPDVLRSTDTLRHPDYIGYGNLAAQLTSLPRHLASLSDESYLIGQRNFSRPSLDPRAYFQKSTLYLLNNKIIDDPAQITLNAVRRFEIYYAPLPPSLQNMTVKNYSAVVRAYSREYTRADSCQQPFNVSGQIVTRKEEKTLPVPGVQVSIKGTGTSTITDASGNFRLPATPQGTLLFHWPDGNNEERAIDGREYFGVYTYRPYIGPQTHLDAALRKLKQRMSETSLAQDREAIQKEINRLKQAIDSLQRDKRHSLNEKIIDGRVTDIETGQPVSGVNIVVKGTSTGTVTNEQGNYRITVPKNRTQLEFTATNYEPVTAHISEKKVVDIQIGQRLEKSLEKALFVVDGQIREDIRSFDELNISKENLKRTETFKGNRWLRLPLEYQNKGYTKVARIFTKDFQPQLAHRTLQGKLIDRDNGQPLAGAEIRWVKQGKKTVLARTDGQGEYQVTLPKDTNVIEYFHPGYALREMPDRFVEEVFPMHWTLSMKREKTTDKKSDFTRQLIISPNPGHDEIKVSFNLNEAASVEFELLDNAGNLLYSFEYHFFTSGNKEVTLPVAKFPADTYLLRVKLNGDYITKRVILND